jgi:beta-fructofuranosidase
MTTREANTPDAAGRRRFLALSVLAALAAPLARATAFLPAAVAPRDLAHDPMRPTYHFLPPAGWINDPNGPIYRDGTYHLFYQYNEKLRITGGMSWGHATSTDMLHWRHQPMAMAPVPGSPDDFGVWTGSCFAVGARTYAVYTGVAKADAAHASVRGDTNLHETQLLAYADDPGLRHWTRPARSIVAEPPAGMQVTGFRDPSIWQEDGYYYMTVGSGEAHKGGCVLLYRSHDLASWTFQHRLVGADWNGAQAVDGGDMWECPEFFPLGDGHVLVYSTDGQAHWLSGTLDKAAMVFHPRKQGLLDGGAFYAPKTQLDAQGDRIAWGWIQETRPLAAFEAAGWAGMVSLPRRLWLDADGQLRMDVAAAVEQLRGKPLPGTSLADGASHVLPRANGEMIMTHVRGVSMDMVVTVKGEHGELMRVSYSAERHSLSVAGRTIALAADEDPHIHLFVDGSVIEAILGHREGYTKRFYVDGTPDLVVATHGLGTMHAAYAIKAATPTVA